MVDFIQRLINILGASGVMTDIHEMKPYITDWRGIFQGIALAVVFPKTSAEVQMVVQLCIEHSIAIIPQGGNTNLTGSSTPEPIGQQIVLSLKRLNQIRSVDLENQTMTVEAGCILQHIQEKASDSGFLFPLSLAAEGSCTIGGNLATNAGGINVLRYGNMRDLCLGIEAVTASGDILHSLRGLRKDNTGYDLRNLLIGSEGTLGIITAAVIKLYPAPINRCAALIAVNDYSIMVNLLQELQRKAANELCAFEMMSRASLDLTVQHFPQFANPIFKHSSHTLLIELAEFSTELRSSQILEDVLGKALESEQIEDVLVSTSLTQVKQFWGVREHITLAQAKEVANIKFDISFEISNIGDFISHTCNLLSRSYPGIRIINFGHFGDGNLHFNMCPPIGSDKIFLKTNEAEIHRIVYEQIEKYQGSISAEHGIGQLKRNDLEHHRGPTAYKMMKQIKHALDPQNLLNPHKVLL
jgi:FAD/FMN-containing dehydrogenase